MKLAEPSHVVRQAPGRSVRVRAYATRHQARGAERLIPRRHPLPPPIPIHFFPAALLDRPPRFPPTPSLPLASTPGARPAPASPSFCRQQDTEAGA